MCFPQLYLVMDFMAGGELFKHLNDQKIMTEKDVRLYGAEILLVGQGYCDLLFGCLSVCYCGCLFVDSCGAALPCIGF